MNYGSEFRHKSSLLNQEGDEEVADKLSDNSSRLPKDGFPQLCEQGDINCQINDIMMYVREKHPQLNLGSQVHPKYGMGCTINVRMMIQ